MTLVVSVARDINDKIYLQKRSRKKIREKESYTKK